MGSGAWKIHRVGTPAGRAAVDPAGRPYLRHRGGFGETALPRALSVYFTISVIACPRDIPISMYAAPFQ